MKVLQKNLLLKNNTYQLLNSLKHIELFSPNFKLGVKPVLYILLFIVPIFSMGQQNLVPNPSFEEYYSCPSSNDLNDGQLELCKGWWKPTMGTSDYFNACNTNGLVDIPNNFWGYQPAYDGNGYVGLVPITWIISTGEYDEGKEYIQAQLLKPLTPCVEYHFEMQVNFANYSRYGFSRLGALFTKNAIHKTNWDAITNTPQVLNNQGILIDTVNWVKISGNFVAIGNEQYLTIGYFFDNVTNDTLNFQAPIGFDDSGYGYYYIDDVSLTEVGPVEDCSYDVPNVLTPNNDGLNDKWEFQSSVDSHMEIVNRWGNTVYEATGNSFSWDGAECIEGVYYYTYTNDKYTKTGFIQLIR
jgi:gliding motility-associated-like protein